STARATATCRSRQLMSVPSRSNARDRLSVRILSVLADDKVFTRQSRQHRCSVKAPRISECRAQEVNSERCGHRGSGARARIYVRDEPHIAAHAAHDLNAK